MSLFDSGIRPKIDEYLQSKRDEVRDYGDYWSASSAGYCMRKLIFEKLGVPKTKEDDPRLQRVFESGHIFHGWVQDITKNAGLSVASEVELQDDTIMVRGHFDDLVDVDGTLILYDYKTQNSRAFSYKRPNMSHYHKMQLGTYLYMLRKNVEDYAWVTGEVNEARIMKISKDDLRMSEEQLMWSPQLEKEVVGYWNTLNGYWKKKTIPECTCADREGGFMSKEAYNPYFYNGEPCSLEWYNKFKEEKSATN